jgi:SAM-dependent methyltransferase
MAEPVDPALAAYESFAPIYDDFSYRNDYEMWFGFLLPELEKLGLKRGGRLLDVACGTGRAFAPMIRRGWRITACDLSPAMIERAIANAPEGVEIEVRDMRELPVYGEFELVWALNDPVNYILADDDLALALRAMAANLAPDGLLAFDCNTSRVFREQFSSAEDEDMSVGEWRWDGLGEVGDRVYEAKISGARVEPHVHRERHWQIAEIRAALVEAGLEPLASLGQRERGEEALRLSPEPDEELDEKIIHVARRA